MPFELKVIAEPLDEQHCGDCPLLKGQGCLVFRRVLARDYSIAATIGIQGAYHLRRLTECIAAEKAAKENTP